MLVFISLVKMDAVVKSVFVPVVKKLLQQELDQIS